jgi:Tfp pilus assembly protein PilF
MPDARVNQAIDTPFRFLPHRPRQFALLGIILLILAISAYVVFTYARANYYFRAAEKARGRRDFVSARRYLEANLRSSPNSANDHFLLARVARQSGLNELAETHLDICQRLEGNSDRVSLERTLLRVQQGGLSRGVESMLRVRLNDDPADADDILEALSVGCLVSYRFTTAVAFLNDWLERRPDNVAALLWRSVALERVHDFVAAREDCRKAVALDPENSEAQLRLGEMLLLTTQIQEAADVLEPLHERQPDNPLVAMRLAQALIKLNRTDEAEQILDRMVSRFPNDAPVLLERARLALDRGQPAASEGWLRRAASLAPWDYQTNYSLLLSLKRQEKENAAKQLGEIVRLLEADNSRLQALNEQLKLQPYDVSPRCEIARVYLRQKHDREAIVWLQSALKIDPQHALANQLLAEYYEGTGQPALALPYRKALAAAGNSAAFSPVSPTP